MRNIRAESYWKMKQLFDQKKIVLEPKCAFDPARIYGRADMQEYMMKVRNLEHMIHPPFMIDESGAISPATFDNIAKRDEKLK